MNKEMIWLVIDNQHLNRLSLPVVVFVCMIAYPLTRTIFAQHRNCNENGSWQFAKIIMITKFSSSRTSSSWRCPYYTQAAFLSETLPTSQTSERMLVLEQSLIVCSVFERSNLIKGQSRGNWWEVEWMLGEQAKRESKLIARTVAKSQ